ncbi:MAG: hypothetical protein V9G04_08455 [Nocardioides sp.]
MGPLTVKSSNSTIKAASAGRVLLDTSNVQLTIVGTARKTVLKGSNHTFMARSAPRLIMDGSNHPAKVKKAIMTTSNATLFATRLRLLLRCSEPFKMGPVFFQHWMT